MRKYWEFLKIEYIQGLHNRGAAIGRFGFYGVILFVFSRLWEVVALKSDLSMSPKDMLWYLAMTELIVLSFPLTHIEIEEDVRTGNLAYSLTKPASYLWSRYWRAFGSVLSRFSILVFAGVFFAYMFSGGFPDQPFGLLLFVPLCLLSLAIGLIFHVVIGICSFWIQDSSPIYWVWQKMGFVLGGMILPLDIYPVWLRDIAMVTPFSALIYEPAKSAITMDLNMAAGAALKLGLWGGGGVLVASFVFSRASKGLVLNGG